jgi:hypothetical protein
VLWAVVPKVALVVTPAVVRASDVFWTVVTPEVAMVVTPAVVGARVEL